MIHNSIRSWRSNRLALVNRWRVMIEPMRIRERGAILPPSWHGDSCPFLECSAGEDERVVTPPGRRTERERPLAPDARFLGSGHKGHPRPRHTRKYPQPF